jgi:hypothetical protein
MTDTTLILHLCHTNEPIGSQRQRRRGLCYRVNSREPVGVRGCLDLDDAGVNFILKFFKGTRRDGVARKVSQRLGVIEELTLTIVVMRQVSPSFQVIQHFKLGIFMVTISLEKLLKISALCWRRFYWRSDDTRTIGKASAESRGVVRSMAVLLNRLQRGFERKDRKIKTLYMSKECPI